MIYQLTSRIKVEADEAATWTFFSRAENLPEITPPWMNFRISSPTPIEISQDAIIDYTIRWAGIPIRWRTQIIDWTPRRQFIDLQIRGPYSLWHHQHTFSPTEGGTECVDRVLYRMPMGPIGRIMNSISVRKQLTEIFEFRSKAIGEKLGRVSVIDGVKIAALR